MLQKSTSFSQNENEQEGPLDLIKPTDFDDLLEVLANEGFTNTIQNIIVLKRFGNDYDKAIHYLRTGSSLKQ